MQFPLIATVLAVFATSAIADNCTPGLNYCGKTLMAVSSPFLGKYQPQIDQAVYDAGRQLLNNGYGDLFYCVGGNNGVIQWKAFCSKGCVDAGRGDSDYCN
ncbi:hypothetical protein V502_10319 [Pseudogymnoascus sp. VKM F-4520 (FW-2644)]|nr:hypothetical protein V502_10319 [Pseudogymnoascus sp. VKM F-4520 (FW-2644)]